MVASLLLCYLFRFWSTALHLLVCQCRHGQRTSKHVATPKNVHFMTVLWVRVYILICPSRPMSCLLFSGQDRRVPEPGHLPAVPRRGGGGAVRIAALRPGDLNRHLGRRQPSFCRAPVCTMAVVLCLCWVVASGCAIRSHTGCPLNIIFDACGHGWLSDTSSGFCAWWFVFGPTRTEQSLTPSLPHALPHSPTPPIPHSLPHSPTPSGQPELDDRQEGRDFLRSRAARGGCHHPLHAPAWRQGGSLVFAP